ncbi:hypothetical protein AB2F01_27765 (plasmid) [Escherichia coli]
MMQRADDGIERTPFVFPALTPVSGKAGRCEKFQAYSPQQRPLRDAALGELANI